MDKIWGRAVLWAAALVLIGNMPALAIPVSGPFGSDSMPKAIFFTGAAKPSSSSESSVLLNRFTGEVSNLTATGGNGIESGIIMTPVGDGSYVCTASVYPGATYNYFFSYRIAQWDIGGAGLDSRTTWTTWRAAGEDRTVKDKMTADNDNIVGRAVSIPVTATNGYYVYNAWGDRTVLGYQGLDSSVLTAANPYLRSFGGTDTIVGVNRWNSGTYARISSSTDTEFANNDFFNSTIGNYEGRVHPVTAVQTGDNQFLVSWSYGGGAIHGGGSGFVPTVDGSRYFLDGGYGGSKHYGYRILRGDSRGVYIDITQTVTGDTNWADDSTNDPWAGTNSFVDTSISINLGDTLTYTVVWHNAYGYSLDSTTALAPQLALGKGTGYDTVAKGSAIRVFFIVEHYNEGAVFKDGANTGRAYLTPYIDGVRRPDLRMPADVIRVVPRRGDIS